jgi:hypothetical protein
MPQIPPGGAFAALGEDLPQGADALKLGDGGYAVCAVSLGDIDEAKAGDDSPFTVLDATMISRVASCLRICHFMAGVDGRAPPFLTES